MARHVFTFPKSDEPVFVAGSFTSPPWEPVQLNDDQQDSSLLRKSFENLREGTYQYKFRLGYDDTRWQVDRASELASDPSGSHLNNVLRIEAAQSEDSLAHDDLSTATFSEPRHSKDRAPTSLDGPIITEDFQLTTVPVSQAPQLAARQSKDDVASAFFGGPKLHEDAPLVQDPDRESQKFGTRGEDFTGKSAVARAASAAASAHVKFKGSLAQGLDSTIPVSKVLSQDQTAPPSNDLRQITGEKLEAIKSAQSSEQILANHRPAGAKENGSVNSQAEATLVELPIGSKGADENEHETEQSEIAHDPSSVIDQAPSSARGPSPSGLEDAASKGAYSSKNALAEAPETGRLQSDKGGKDADGRGKFQRNCLGWVGSVVRKLLGFSATAAGPKVRSHHRWGLFALIGIAAAVGAYMVQVRTPKHGR